MPKIQTTKTGYTAPGVSVTITFRKAPIGYIKDVPIKGTASAQSISAAVAKVIAARPACATGSAFRISIPASLIKKGENVRIGA